MVCKGPETLTEWKFESVTDYGWTDQLGRCRIRQVPRLTSIGSGSENLTSAEYAYVSEKAKQVFHSRPS